MHAEYGSGKHFYQIETQKLNRAELERVKHELSLARSEIDRLRRAGKENNCDHLEALREIVQEQSSSKEKVGAIYCFGANSVPRDFVKKILHEMQLATRNKQCPPYLNNILELCIPAEKRKLRQQCGLQVQC